MATYTVTTLDDEAFGGGESVGSPDGTGLSLREAIALANANAGFDTIEFAVSGTIRLTLGQIAITDGVTIDGDNDDDDAPDILITGDADDDDVTLTGTVITDVAASGDAQLDDNSRIFDIGTGADTTLDGLVLTGGRTTAYNESGGAVRSAATLTIENSTLSGNSTAGDFAHGGAAAGAIIVVDNSTFSGNSTTGNYAEGGAIHAVASATVKNSTLTDNLTTGDSAKGGAVYGETVYVEDSTLSGNSTANILAEGGAIFAADGATIANSTLTGNSATGSTARGGAVYAGGQATITNSTLSDNFTLLDAASGGAVYAVGGATISDSTLSGNSTAGDGAAGGAVFASGGGTITNSTFSGNSTSGVVANGGAVAGFNDLAISNSTLSGNAVSGLGSSGGAIASSSGSLSLTDSIVLGNVAQPGQDDQLYVSSSSSASYSGLNIVGGATAGPNVIDAAASDVFASTYDNGGVQAGVLADNGGQVWTILLKGDPANPALDATAFLLGTTPETDARGGARPVDLPGISNGGALDLGALELQSLPVTTAQSLVVTTLEDELDFAGPDATLELMGGAGDLSLREAIFLANATIAADTIAFAADLLDEDPDKGATIRLTLGELAVSGSVTIDGDLDDDGAPDIVITGDADGDDETETNPFGYTVSLADDDLSALDDDNSRIFSLEDTAASVTLDGLVLTGAIGRTNSGIYSVGGAIYSRADLLRIEDTIIAGNMNDGNGGGVFVTGGNKLEVVRTTIADNLAQTTAGIGMEGTDFLLRDSTVSGNAATVGIGGIQVFVTGSGSPEGTANVVNATIAGNTSGADIASGIQFFGTNLQVSVVNSTITGNDAQGLRVADGAGLTLRDSIVLGNGIDAPQELNGGVASYEGLNIIGSGVDTVADPNVITADPEDVFAQTSAGGGGVLGSNGGPVQTVLLKADASNPALDASAGDVDTPATDARGFARPADLAAVADGGGTVDLGALERQSLVTGPVTYGVTTLDDELDSTAPDASVETMGGVDDLSLREAIFLANQSPDTADTIIFDLGLSGGTIFLTLGETLVVKGPLTIDGDWADTGFPGVAVSGDAGMNDLTTTVAGFASVTDAVNNTSGGDNVGVFEIDLGTSGEVIFDSLVVTGGAAGQGGIRNLSGDADVVIVDGAIVGNAGSGFYAEGGGLTVEDSLIGGNTGVDGAGIYKRNGAFEIAGSTVSGNIASNRGGGLFTDTTVTITGSTISGNEAAEGGGVYTDTAITVFGSTFSGNSATTGDGGGIYAAGTLTATNATLVGNDAGGEGGGLFYRGSPFGRLTNVTVTGNTANGAGAGVHVSDTELTLSASLILGNEDEDNVGTSGFVTLGTQNGTIVGDGSISAADVFAGPLADNGGPVQTVALLADPSNPALDQGDPAALDETALGIDFNGDGDTDDVISTDARGFARSVSLPGAGNDGEFVEDVVDLGAFELQAADYNTDPTAVDDDQAVTDEDIPVVIDLLGNDEDEEGGLSVVSISDPANGTATLNPDGTVTYTPDPDFNGTDSFTYTLDDGRGGTASGTVIVNVEPVNDAPVAVDDTGAVATGGTLDVAASGVLPNDTDIDGDTLTVDRVDGGPAAFLTPVVGTYGTLLLRPDGSYVYVADQDAAAALEDGETAEDVFLYDAVDPSRASDMATLTITVTGTGETTPTEPGPEPNAPPVARDDRVAVARDGVTTGNLFVDNGAGPDLDPDDDPITVRAVNGSTLNIGQDLVLASGAILRVEADGSFAYDPNGAFDGASPGADLTDDFTYRIADDENTSSGVAMVRLEAERPDSETVDGTQDDDVFVFDDLGHPRIVDGMGGNDIVTLPGAFADFTIEPIEGGFRFVPQAGEPVELSSIETVVFDDRTLVLDRSAAVELLHLVYDVSFDRGGDIPGLTFWNGIREEGMSLDEIADYFPESQEFARLYGEDVSDEEFVRICYENGLEREAEDGGLDYWTNLLETGALDRGDVVLYFARSDEAAELNANLVDDGTYLLI